MLTKGLAVALRTRVSRGPMKRSGYYRNIRANRDRREVCVGRKFATSTQVLRISCSSGRFKCPAPASAAYFAAAFLTAVNSISTSNPGPARPATLTAARAGLLGCAAVPNSVSQTLFMAAKSIPPSLLGSGLM